ncbi:MAG: hypothetical protein WCF72_10330, partial [Pseudolabrys sp.]
MKVNVVVFAFLLFLITSGVWLPDGLTASFGPEHLLHHHTQNRDAGPGRIVVDTDAAPAKRSFVWTGFSPGGMWLFAERLRTNGQAPPGDERFCSCWPRSKSNSGQISRGLRRTHIRFDMSS